jgi:cytochrome c oxidase subunit 4
MRMAEHLLQRRTYYTVYAILMVCTYLTWQVAYFDLGSFNTVAALGIAAFKAVLVILFFMHVRGSPRLVSIVVISGLFWLGILLALTMSDYLTRGWMSEAHASAKWRHVLETSGGSERLWQFSRTKPGGSSSKLWSPRLTQ